MPFIQIRIIPTGTALVDIDTLPHAAPEDAGTHLFLGAQHLDMPHTLDEPESILAGRDRIDDGELSPAGLGIR